SVRIVTLCASVALAVLCLSISFFFQAEDGIRDRNVTGVQTCALPISIADQLLLAFCFRCQLVTLVSTPSSVFCSWRAASSVGMRSEERRVGKECRSRGAADH